MEKNNLPTEELKEYGIINADNSFSKKLSQQDIEDFLNGKSILAENGKNRILFTLSKDKRRLDIDVYHRKTRIESILEESEKGIQYDIIQKLKNLENVQKGDTITFKSRLNEKGENKEFTFDRFIRESQTAKPLLAHFKDKEGNEFALDYHLFKDDIKDVVEDSRVKAFVFNQETKTTTEYDLIKDIEKVRTIVEQKQDAIESNRYKTELLKLKEFLQDKIDKFPEIAKDITNDLNIVSREVESVNAMDTPEKQQNKQEKGDVQLNVNDPDLYQDANRMKEEQEQEQEQERKRGFRR
ncbi:hypothetical protein EDL99_09230 [Ornithobacterium rhinotracheale]|uniref:hypothetical protein n=1 Tax=Ornithobacterium rhinotracheale TaxID=28251 RepID=UPI00129C2E90|nr:hypothetical protein [Ornithobacterium rhinotracheale]MRJ09040.1 hypothetical protein [Ornithobacterium rhinotracheale]UOH77812.1 hypothetical protein MT996_11505 [Ornithobacterium rhinotracheale]